MLAIFQASVADKAPKELMAPKISRLQSISGRLDAAELLQRFKDGNPSTVLMQFDDQHAMAFAHDRQMLLAPRQFAASGDIFCAFSGNVANIAQLRHLYGLDRHMSEVNLMIQAYKTLRDRRPYSADQVVAEIQGGFAFVLYDHQYKKVFVAADREGKVPLYWGKCMDDGVISFSDDAPMLKAGTGSSFAPFPLGCYYSSDDGLQCFAHPEKRLKAMPHVDSQGQLCGSTFRVDSSNDLASSIRASPAANEPFKQDISFFLQHV